MNNGHQLSFASAPASGQAPTPIVPTARRGPDRELGDRVRSLRLAARSPARPNVIGTRFALVIGLIFVAIASWYAYAAYPAANLESQDVTRTATTADTSSQAAPARLELSAGQVAQDAKGGVVLEAKGYVVPAHQILVTPKVSGLIIKLNLEEGRRVTKDDILAVLESTEYEADVSKATANVQLMRERLRELNNGHRIEEIKQAEADLGEAQVQMAQFEAEYTRTDELRKRNSVTQQDYELAHFRLLGQRHRIQRLELAVKLMRLGPRGERIEIAKAELVQAEADVIKAEWRLRNCTIRAPISGTILKKSAEEGSIINPIAFNGSFSLCEMADLSDLEIDLSIQERDIAAIKIGQKCRVKPEANPNLVYVGVVDRLMPRADRAKGAVPVRVKLQIRPEENGAYLRPEMGALVTFLNEQAF